MNTHKVMACNASKMREWFATRGGLAIWRSVDLSNPGGSWTSPRLTADGVPTTKPHWQADSFPERTITDPAEVMVITPREVKRFRVGVRRGSQGFMLKLTDGASRKVRAAVAKAGDDAWYEFDYATQEAVIYTSDAGQPLSEWRP